MTNSADPDQYASSEADWSGSTLFAKAGYIRAQQDKGKRVWYKGVNPCHAEPGYTLPLQTV